MTTEELHKLSYYEIEKCYSDKDQQYLPIFLIQSKYLYSFLSEQTDPDLKNEEIVGVLFLRMSYSK